MAMMGVGIQGGENSKLMLYYLKMLIAILLAQGNLVRYGSISLHLQKITDMLVKGFIHHCLYLNVFVSLMECKCVTYQVCWSAVIINWRTQLPLVHNV